MKTIKKKMFFLLIITISFNAQAQIIDLVKKKIEKSSNIVDKIINNKTTDINNETTTNQQKINTKKSKFNLGDKVEGGVIYYLDSTGEHGLITTITDLNKKMDDTNWEDAVKMADMYRDKSGKSGWRLPTADELVKLCDAKKIVEGLEQKVYWSSTTGRNYDYRLTVQMVNCNENGTGTPMYVRLNVRAVKSF